MSAGGLSAGPSVETKEQPAETRKPERKPRRARPRSKAGDAPAPERLRLLVLASTFPRSADDSTPSFVLELCRRLQARFDVTVITPAVPGARDRQEIDGVRVERFHYFWPGFLERLADGAMLENLRHNRWLLAQAPLLLLCEFAAAYRWARRAKPAVIHAHWLVPQGLVAVAVGRLLRIPVVSTSHGGDIAGLRGGLWSRMRRFVARRSRAVTVVSTDLRERLKAETGAKREAAVMPMGVDTGRFRAGARAPKGKTVLFVGRLAEKKGVEYLIRAFPAVLERHPDARLDIVGDGPERRKLGALAGELGLKGRAKFAGAQPQAALPAFYSRCRVFVGPSVIARSGDTEGFGVVFLEAMACGRPVVASKVGGIPDIVADGRTGLLVEPASSSALAAAINRLLDEPETAERMGRLAARWVRRKFDWEGVAGGYADLLSRAGRRRTIAGRQTEERVTHVKLPEELTADDYEISATVRHLGRLDKILQRLEALPPQRRPKSLLDLGCGIGGLTLYISRKLGIEERIGVDVDEERLARAAERGLKTLNVNLSEERLPLADASVGLVTSFGVFEHLVFYDNTVSEAARVLEDGGYFLLSMPNLASYINRAALLLGYQPREVEVSKVVPAGIVPLYRNSPSKGIPLGHVHAATLRSMRELLTHFGFRMVTVEGFSPDFGSAAVRMFDGIFGNIPSLARRFIILARRRSRQAQA